MTQTNPTSISEDGAKSIKGYEGLELTAYECEAKVPSIGYGHTKGITKEDITNQKTITLQEADAYFKSDIQAFEKCVSDNVKVPVNQNQYDALVSLAYNIGCSAFKASTLLKQLNAQKYNEAAEQFLVWNKVTKNGQKVVSEGLKKRREREKACFTKCEQPTGTFSMFKDFGKRAINATSSIAEITAKVLGGGLDIKQAAKELVGGVELSLNGIDLANLYGFNFDPNNQTLIALCQKSNESDHDKDEKELSEYDSILKKCEKNQQSIMVWQHFCAFLKMFHDHGDRESVSFSLDPAQKIEKDKTSQNVGMKKVYYPENLRWSKAGEVMFDADLFIKTLLYDLHPDITQQIPNYKSYIQKTLHSINWDESEQDTPESNRNWHRLWIVVDEIEESQADHSFIIDKIKFKIQVRRMNVGADGKLHDDLSENEDSLLKEFVDHMNNNMDIIHKHSLFLQRLEHVFRALLLAKFAFTSNIPFNMDLIEEVCNKQQQELQEFGIIFELPSLVKKEQQTREIIKGDYLVKQFKNHTFSGGINLSIKPDKKPQIRSTSSSGINRLKQLEGFKEKAYSLNGVPHIGWGHIVTKKDVKTINDEEGETFLKKDVLECERFINEHVKVPLNQNQYDALVLFTINVGGGAFGGSTLLKKLNRGDYKGAAEQFDVWNKITVKGEDGKETKVVCKGLVNRRKIERDLFESVVQPKGVKEVKVERSVDIQLKSLDKTFNRINQRIAGMKKEFDATRIAFEKLCDVKNKDREYTAVLFPNILIEQNKAKLCESMECKEDISWQKANIFDGKNYCPTHYKEHRYSQCTKCKKDIDKLHDQFRAMGSSKGNQLMFHQECCKCYHCDKKLGENIRVQSKKSNDGKEEIFIYCDEKCAKKAAGFDEENCIKQCFKCKQDINIFEETDIIQTGNGHVLHGRCLKCDECGKSLKGGQTIMDNENHTFCSDECANKKALESLGLSDNIEKLICDKCNQEILNEYCRFGDNIFLHAECIKCVECDKVIQGGKSIMDNKNNIFCSKICANKKAMKAMSNNNDGGDVKCHKCKKDILLTQGDVVTISNDIMLHRNCTVCFQCGEALTGGVSMDDKKNLFCSSECGNSFHNQ